MEEVDVARLRHLRPRHYGRMTAVVVTLLLLALLVDAFARGKIDWSTTGEYLFWPTILQGLVNTIWVSIACMAIGIIIGVLCAVARGSPNPVLRSAALFYAWFFRGTPVILQLLIWFNLALVFPRSAYPVSSIFALSMSSHRRWRRFSASASMRGPMFPRSSAPG